MRFCFLLLCCSAEILQWIVRLDKLPSDFGPLERQLGVEFGQFLGDNEFLVLSEPDFAQSARNVENVVSVERRRGSKKIGTLSSSQTGLRSSENGCELLARLFAHIDISRDLEVWERLGGFESSVIFSSAEKVVIKLEKCDSKTLQTIAQAIADDEAIESIEFRNTVMTRNKFSRTLVTGFTGSNIPQVSISTPIDNRMWKAGFRGEGQIIGIADTGIDMDNCMFWEQTPYQLNKLDLTRRKVVAYMTYSGASCGLASRSACADGSDSVDGHGTHVSGTAAGSASTPAGQEANRNFASAYNGVAPDAKIFFTDIGRSDGSLYPPVDLNAGLFPDVYASGARVHSDSWGCSPEVAGGCNVYDSASREIDLFVWEHPDFVVVIAAGNSGNDRDTATIESPGGAKNCISIGSSQTVSSEFLDAVSVADVRRQMCTGGRYSSCCGDNTCTVEQCCKILNNIRCCASLVSAGINETSVSGFSSRGPALGAGTGSSGLIKPDIIVPGDNIISANSNGVYTSGCQCDPPSNTASSQSSNSAVRAMAGTSMAAPLAAGLVAIVREYFIKGNYQGSSMNPSAALVKAILVASALPLGSVWRHDLRQAFPIPPTIFSNYFGFGVPNIANVLLTSSPHVLYVQDSISVSTNQEQKFIISAAAVSPSTPLVLVLAYSDYPAAVQSQNPIVNNLDLRLVDKSTNKILSFGNGGAAGDSLNNVEKIIFSKNFAGDLVVSVAGISVPKGPQRFAVVIFGAFGKVSLGDSGIVDNSVLTANGPAGEESSGSSGVALIAVICGSVGGGIIFIAVIILTVMHLRSRFQPPPTVVRRHISAPRIPPPAAVSARRDASLTSSRTSRPPPLFPTTLTDIDEPSSITPIEISMTPMSLLGADPLARSSGNPSPSSQGTYVFPANMPMTPLALLTADPLAHSNSSPSSSLTSLGAPVYRGTPLWLK